MPNYQFCFVGPSADEIKSECPIGGAGMAISDPTPAITRVIENALEDDLPYLIDYHTSRGWRYDGEVSP